MCQLDPDSYVKNEHLHAAAAHHCREKTAAEEKKPGAQAVCPQTPREDEGGVAQRPDSRSGKRSWTGFPGAESGSERVTASPVASLTTARTSTLVTSTQCRTVSPGQGS